jgi:hypothetical protein
VQLLLLLLVLPMLLLLCGTGRAAARNRGSNTLQRCKLNGRRGR